MSTTLTLDRLKVDILGSLKNDDPLAPATAAIRDTLTLALANGTGAGKALDCIVKQYTIAAGATQNVDLTGSGADPLAGTPAAAKVKIICVILGPTPAAASLKIGGHATASLKNWITSADTLDNDQPAVRCGNGPAGGIFLITRCDATGYAVTATTGDLLSIKNEDGSLSAVVDVLIFFE